MRYQRRPIGPYTLQTEFDDNIGDLDLHLELEKPRYPDIACITPGRPYVLHCFSPHKSEVTREQYRHLNIIADKIAASFSTPSPITSVRIDGHSSTWHRTSRKQLEARALQRANNAATALKNRLADRKVAHLVKITTLGHSDTIPWRGKPYSSTSGSRHAQSQRALNRRVEIQLTKRKTPSAKKKCDIEDLMLAKKLKEMPIAGLSNDRAERKRMKCLRDLFVRALRCEINIDDEYLLFPFRIEDRFRLDTKKAFEKRSLISDLKTTFRLRCKKKPSGTKHAKCFKMVFDDLQNAITDAGILAGKWKSITHMGPKAFSRSDHCFPLCFMIEKAAKKSHRSIYFCFVKKLDLFTKTVCKKCHLRPH